jgi:dCTP deaminase
VSVVPLIRGTTVVESRNEYEAAGGRRGETILILDLDHSQLRPNADDESNLTYDLRVGDEYRDHRDTEKQIQGRKELSFILTVP